MADNVFSLHIGNQHTRLGHVGMSKGKIELLSLGYDNTISNYYANTDDKTAQAQASVIQALHDSLNIRSSKVHVVLPDTLTYSQLLLMPDLPEAELVKSIRLQADELIPLPISEVYLDLEIISKLPNGKLLILFIAAPKKTVDHIHATIEYANYEPITLENELSATGRFITEFFKFIKEPALILNLGYTGSSLYVVNPAFPFFQLTRSSRIGYDIMYRDLQINANLGDQKTAEALRTIGLSNKGSVNIYSVVFPVLNELMSDMEKTILLVSEKYRVPIRRIYVFNYDAHIGFLHETIQNRLQLPTQSFPLSSVLIPNTITQTFSHILSTFLPVITTHIR